MVAGVRGNAGTECILISVHCRSAFLRFQTGSMADVPNRSMKLTTVR